MKGCDAVADVKWIKITTDMFDNRKLKHLRRLPDGNNIVLIWVMLLTMAGRCNAGGMIFLTENIPYTAKMLSDELDFEETTVQLALKALEQLNMIVTDSGFFKVAGWEEYQNIDGLDKIREQNRLRKAAQRERQKALPEVIPDVSRDSHGTVTQCHAIDKEKELDLESKKEEISIPCEKKPSKAEIDEFFDFLWQLYPVKKGKGQVSEAKRKALYAIGNEEMQRAIWRYLNELKKDADWRKPQNGSTFFCSGYVDYLDANFAPDETRKGGMTNANSSRNTYQSGYEEVGTWL
jgi:predicted phage replisome organizer